MDNLTLHHVLYRLANAQVHSYPYPHFYVENVFPDAFYKDLIDSLPEEDCYRSLSQSGKVDPRTYRERLVIPLDQERLSQLPFAHCLFWSQFSQAIESDLWRSTLLSKFDREIKERFGSHYENVTFSSSAELIRDRTKYSIGPHTDHPIRVVTLLFYFPRTQEQAHLGTSVYQHTDPTFECEGFIHHPFDSFVKLHSAPFLPNSAFGFVRSGRSFHGVEPILDGDVERNLLQYYLQWNHKK